MNIYKTNLFKYIAGDSLVGKSVAMTIDRVVMENVPTRNGKDEEKLVLYFSESKKGMILNKTNAKCIGKLFGPETDAWQGKVIELFTEPVAAFGDTHNAIRVREAKIQAIANKTKNENLTPEQRKARRADNPLRTAKDEPIGETNGNWKRFTERVVREIPFFANEAEVRAALELHELQYDPDDEETCFTELAIAAGREADTKANDPATEQAKLFDGEDLDYTPRGGIYQD